MRLWHVDLIPYLPKLQLLSQWRECVCIAKNIVDKGTPNHLLVNKVLDYNSSDFEYYCKLVEQEMIKRGYKINSKVHDKLFNYILDSCWKFNPNHIHHDYVFEGWHDDRYLTQCFFNLQEKFDCGGIPKDEWEKLNNWYWTMFREE